MPPAKEMAPATTDAIHAIQKVTAAKPLASAQQHTPGPPTDLVAMPRSEWSVYLIARQDGFLEGERVGFARGYQACDDEISTLQREAAKVVLRMAGIDSFEIRQARAAGRHARAARPRSEAS